MQISYYHFLNCGTKIDAFGMLWSMVIVVQSIFSVWGTGLGCVHMNDTDIMHSLSR